MQTKRKLFYFDCETTGVETNQGHKIHQLAGLMEIDGKVAGEINLEFRPGPEHTTKVDYKQGQDAVKKYGKKEPKIIPGLVFSKNTKIFWKENPELNISEESIMEREMDSEQAYTKLVQFLGGFMNWRNKEDRATLVAYNAAFDEGFLRGFMDDHKGGLQWSKYGSFFFSGHICVMSKVCELFSRERHLMNPKKSVKLELAAQYMDINTKLGGPLHDAMADIMLTRKVYKASHFMMYKRMHQHYAKRILNA